MNIGVITGMVIEARCFGAEPANLTIEVTGADRNRTRDACQKLCRAGVESLLSFGLAGGLDPRFEPGDLIIADSVIGSGGARHETESRCRPILSANAKGILPYQIAPIIGSAVAIRTKEEKAELYRKYGAAAVDMESDIVAEMATASSLPFVVVRAVADAADCQVPDAAIVGLGEDGRTRPFSVMGSLITRPSELLPLIKLALGTRRALAALRLAAPLIQEAMRTPEG
ncbi:MAG: hypothetical protein GY791_21555 [Alphaproteobacteria bacterium]|nr:hypothetical protein [Alphaproteobacteria bacterium]